MNKSIQYILTWSKNPFFPTSTLHIISKLALRPNQYLENKNIVINYKLIPTRMSEASKLGMFSFELSWVLKVWNTIKSCQICDEKKTTLLHLVIVYLDSGFSVGFQLRLVVMSFQNGKIKLNFILNAGGLKAFVNFAQYIY